jgi:DNA-binding transcriptional LysR family regulator
MVGLLCARSRTVQFPDRRQIPSPVLALVHHRNRSRDQRRLSLHGAGLIQIPRYRAAAELASGELVEVLPQFPPPALPIHVLYSHTPQLSPRLRVVIDWMAEQFRSMVTP